VHARRKAVQLSFAKVGPDPREKGKWSVAFGITTTQGNHLDGPVFVIVDDATGHAEFL
jgi:hypothetical protein